VAQAITQVLPVLDVYKRKSCGCCGKWVTHINDNGFQTTVHNQEKLSEFKLSKNIEPEYHSCHTAVSKQGYVFEGHIPAKFIQQFLEQEPKGAIGLAVPAMPMGSPGMEMNGMFFAYKVLLLKADGSSEVFAEVNAAEEQY